MRAESINWLRLGFFLALGLGAVIAGAMAYMIGEVRFERITLEQDERLVRVKSGQSFSELARGLERQGIIEDAWRFSAYARALGAADSIHAGEYRIRHGELLGTFLSRLQRGDVASYRLSLIEGRRIGEVLSLMRETPGIVFAEPIPPIEELAEWLGLPWRHGEGSILPDTYFFRSGEQGQDILRRAADGLKAELLSVWDGRDRDLPLASPYELLILASLIEKESGSAPDAFRISRVFVNRLDIGMRLQADPSVIYGLGDAFTGDLLRRHLREDTPYNTYTRYGLPPTPISLVSLHSLRAAAHPEDGSWKYFVSRGDGTSEFSRTLSEHNRAVRTYISKR